MPPRPLTEPLTARCSALPAQRWIRPRQEIQRPPQRPRIGGGSQDTLLVSPECISGGQLAFFVHIPKRSCSMSIRTIAAALVVAAPLFVVGSHQAAACWE